MQTTNSSFYPAQKAVNVSSAVRPLTAKNTMSTEDRVLLKIRDRVKARGTRGIQSIGRMFRVWDDNRNGSISCEEGKKGFTELRIDLSEAEIDCAFRLFDRNGDGNINYEEFLRTIRGEMNDQRKAICMRAFKKMDKDGSGVIDVADVKGTYDCSKHPKLING